MHKSFESRNLSKTEVIKQWCQASSLLICRCIMPSPHLLRLCSLAFDSVRSASLIAAGRWLNNRLSSAFPVIGNSPKPMRMSERASSTFFFVLGAQTTVFLRQTAIRTFYASTALVFDVANRCFVKRKMPAVFPARDAHSIPVVLTSMGICSVNHKMITRW